MYNKYIMDHFKNPRNQGVLKKPDGEGEAGNPVCGDMMHIYLNVTDDKITDIKFETLGCAVAIATSSVMTTLAKDKSLAEAARLNKMDIINELGGKDQIPPQKFHCSIIAEKALNKAIADYRKKHS